MNGQEAILMTTKGGSMETPWYKQPSTWKGVTLLLSVLGIVVTPEHIVQIAEAGGILYGLLAVFWDKN